VPGGCDNVLRGSGYRTPQEWRQSVMKISRWETRSDATSSTTNLIYSHPGLNPRLRGEKPEPCSLNNAISFLSCSYIFDSGLEHREYGRGDALRWPRDTLYPQKLALASPTSGDRSVGIVRLRTKATEFSFSFSYIFDYRLWFTTGVFLTSKLQWFRKLSECDPC
jgi:hypothetical protein